MTRPLYADPRLTALYDAINPPGPDHAFYLALAEPPAKRVLDVGCGTGVLACAFAARGHRVTGAEPAEAMLSLARRRPDGRAVTWIGSGALELDLEARFDQIVMTGHVFQVFLEDREIAAVLANLRRHLAPGGRLTFETRNPEIRCWDQWRPKTSAERVHVPDVGEIEVHWDIREEAWPFVTYETHVRLPDGTVIVEPDTLRFLELDALSAMIEQAGFGKTGFYGDWDGSPIAPDCPEFIVVADG